MNPFSYGGLTSCEIAQMLKFERQKVLGDLRSVSEILQYVETEEVLEKIKSLSHFLEEKNKIILMRNCYLELLLMYIIQDSELLRAKTTLSVSEQLDKIEKEEEYCAVIDELYRTVKAQLLRHIPEERFIELKISSQRKGRFLSIIFPCNFNELFFKEKKRITKLAEFHGLILEYEFKEKSAAFSLKFIL